MGPSSLRRKIALSYYLFGGVIILLAVFMFLEVNYVEQRFLQGEGVLRFSENTLEVRRYEKNFFLYRHVSDYEKNLDHLRQALSLLDANHDLFATILGVEKLQNLEDQLAEYQISMGGFRRFLQDPRHKESDETRLEHHIRDLGQQITSVTDNLTREERRLVHDSINLSIRTSLVVVLILAALAIVIGRTLSRHVISSLHLLEESLDTVADGNFQPLTLPSGERELVSIHRAFNRMLHALDQHEKHRVQSEKLASLGTMLSGMAHELNNPLSNISSSCQILMEDADDMDPAFRRRLLQQIDEQTLRARNIIRSLLDFSRNRIAESQRVSVKQLIDETMPMLASQLPMGIALDIQVPEGLHVRANKQRLQQVFLNLIKNSLDAMGESGSITVSAEKKQLKPDTDSDIDSVREQVVIRVQDTGPGISEEAQQRIFDPFYTTKDVGDGAGLGLFVVHEIIKEHDGSIELDSDANQGVRFIITLPSPTNEASDDNQDTQNPEDNS